MSKFYIYLDYSGSMFGIGKDSVLVNSLRSIIGFSETNPSLIKRQSLEFFKLSDQVSAVEIDEQQRIRWPKASKQANIDALIDHIKRDQPDQALLLSDGHFSFKEKKQLSELLKDAQGDVVLVLIGPDADYSGFGWAKDRVIYSVGNLEQALYTAIYGLHQSSLDIRQSNQVQFAKVANSAIKDHAEVEDDWATAEDDWAKDEDDWATAEDDWDSSC